VRDLWIFKYQPQDIQEMILEKSTRKDLEKVIKELPNFILFSKPGMGKGTFANIFVRDTIGKENTLWLNGSDENSVDVMRTKVKDFARSYGYGGAFKYVIINEADRLSTAAQDMLREEIEKVNKICGFMFMINEPQRIVEAHFSRFWWISFNNPIATDIFDFCSNILKFEGVNISSTNTKKNLISLIKKLYPDIRRIVNTLQFNVRNSKLETNYITKNEEVYEDILNGMLELNFDEVRKILKSSYIDYTELYNFLYEKVGKFKSPGDAVINIAEHLYRDDKVAIKEINFMHMFFNMMKNGVI
jgi:DNA polymerase III delta prime subunit